MAFKKGQTGNKNGRPDGAKNKRTEQWEIFTQYCLTGGLAKFEKELNKLTGKDYVIAFSNLLEFHKPKLSRTDINHNGEITHKTIEINIVKPEP